MTEQLPIETELRRFLDKLCSKLGICLFPQDIATIFSKLSDACEADDFLRDVFIAEGLNPEIQNHLFRQSKKLFIEHFGSNQINKQLT
ncbi:hypothetical protein [Candidatus Albibeggiatoa sp. nov. NOAA]|uniref:hypothetical protein n=1 Tax=Candidatus Albibeggiatoa sp. nov. NOAA TaxID=3162724 RepID=UPI0032FADD01|nr:hypothetical protein [Thiotrichaceae bacterium]